MSRIYYSASHSPKAELERLQRLIKPILIQLLGEDAPQSFVYI